jgi:hypothetical protein
MHAVLSHGDRLSKGSTPSIDTGQMMRNVSDIYVVRGEIHRVDTLSGKRRQHGFAETFFPEAGFARFVNRDFFAVIVL